MVEKNVLLLKHGTAKTSALSSGRRAVVIIIAIFFNFGGVYLAGTYGPLLLRDFGIKESLRPATRFHIVDATCRRSLMCEIKAAEFPGGPGHELRLEYLLHRSFLGDRSVRLLEQVSDPHVITMDIGQNNLTYRALTLCFMIGFFCFFIPFYVYRKIKASSRCGTSVV